MPVPEAAMSAGRPPKNPTEALPELAELRAWLTAALAGAGYDNVHQFLARNKQFARNQVYDVRNGTRYLDLPVMKALAAALGRPPGEVEPLWFSAKRAREQNEQLHTATARRPRSWETLPQPEPGVRYLLLAEADEAQLLPYQLLGIEPPSLPLIYVRQYLRGWLPRPQATDEPGDLADGTAREENARPAAEVLSRHDYVLVTGGPGSGKTALVRELARRLARIWLREDPASDPPIAQPAVPLLIPARALTDSGSFTSALAAAVRKVYGMDMLTELRPLHFAGPVSGSRWLLIIDGLDEVVDRELRVKIIRAIRGHARADTPYRFVVTSRPLPEAELRSLWQEPFTAVSVEPFGRRELREFAGKWFTTQNPATASEQSRSFVREISDPRLREAARNPLLATIAAVAKTRDPGLPLPASRVDLYERFCGFLIGDEANGRTTLAQIRQRTGEPGYRAAEWVYGHREEMVTWLAERYLGGEPALLDAARAWIRDNLPADIGESPKADDLRLLLAGTGVLMAEGADLRFTHHTLAEYLAAQAMARRMTADLTGQPNLKAMIDRGLEAAQETSVVFTLVLWGRAGSDLGGLLRHLLDGPPRQSLLAGRILGECGGTRPAEASQVIDRLMDMALGDAGVVFRDDFGDDPLRRRGEQDPDPLAAAPGEAFWLLGRIHGDSHVATVLRSVAASGELAVETRTDAAVALGWNSDRDGAIEILRSLPEDHTPPAARVRIAEAIIALNPDATDAAEAVLRTTSTRTAALGPPSARPSCWPNLASRSRPWTSRGQSSTTTTAPTRHRPSPPSESSCATRELTGPRACCTSPPANCAKAGPCSVGSSSNLRNGASAITSSSSAGQPLLILAPSNGNGRAWPEGGHSRLAPPPSSRSSASWTNEEHHIRRLRGKFPCGCWKRDTWMRRSKSRWASCNRLGSVSDTPTFHGSPSLRHRQGDCQKFFR